MSPPLPISIALETAGRVGHVALGIGDHFTASREISRTRQRNLELVPTLNALLSEHDLGPRDIDELYVSLGPGSFTGLRMAIATAQMLALAQPSLKLVGVPTLDVLAHQHQDAAEHVAVMLNLKRGTAYCAAYQAGACILDPAIRTTEALLDLAHRPLAIIAEVDPGLPDDPEITWLDPSTTAPDPATTWHVGHALARQEKFTDPPELLPLYIREPEAVTLWEQQGKA